jgi:hypothetical protein
MLIQPGSTKTRIACAKANLAFTLAEVLVAFAILALVISGICFGYSQANKIATWCSMSQAAQAFAIRGMESARAAKFNPWAQSSVTNTGPAVGSQMELPPQNPGNNLPASMAITNVLDIPMLGNPQTNFNYYATDFVYVTWFPSNGPVPVEQILSQCVWTFPLSGHIFTNSLLTLRGPDQ